MKKASIYLSISLFLGLTISCGTGNREDQTETAKNEITFLTDFKIIAYSGPPQDEVNLERYQEIADAGIEYLVPANGAMDGETNLKAMDLGQQVGLKIIPVDLRLLPFMLEQVVAIDTAAIRSIVNDYTGHPAMAAYVVRDEPHGDLFPDLRKICDVYRALDPEHEPLINVLPSYGSPTMLGFEDYRSYVVSYIETVEPRLFSYDFYALREGHTMYEGWYSDLAIVREETRKADIPFVVFIQSEGIDKGLRVPNRAETLWQVNTVLAYGARGVGWFCYWTPAPDQGFSQDEDEKQFLVEPHYNAMIDINGNRTELYDYVKEANLYLKEAGKGLLEWDNTEVARYKAGGVLEGSSPVVTPEGEGANLVIGTYRLDKKARVVISNSSCEEPASFTLTVDPQWKTDGIFTSIDATPTEGTLTEWTLEPGGSVILELR
ncbi:MAG: hypothetical protein ABFS28_01210 [Bacteroidota bacterium]